MIWLTDTKGPENVPSHCDCDAGGDAGRNSCAGKIGGSIWPCWFRSSQQPKNVSTSWPAMVVIDRALGSSVCWFIGSVGGREIDPRGRKARNGRPFEVALLIGPDPHERDLVPALPSVPQRYAPSPVPTSTKVVAVLCTGNRRKNTRTGEMVTDAFEKIRTRATAKLNVGLPLLSAGRNSSADASSSCDNAPSKVSPLVIAPGVLRLLMTAWI